MLQRLYVALHEIQPWLLELADACGERVPQAVICSHHPELLDYLGGENGLLLQREIRCRHHPQTGSQRD